MYIHNTQNLHNRQLFKPEQVKNRASKERKRQMTREKKITSLRKRYVDSYILPYTYYYMFFSLVSFYVLKPHTHTHTSTQFWMWFLCRRHLLLLFFALFIDGVFKWPSEFLFTVNIYNTHTNIDNHLKWEWWRKTHSVKGGNEKERKSETEINRQITHIHTTI